MDLKPSHCARAPMAASDSATPFDSSGRTLARTSDHDPPSAPDTPHHPRAPPPPPPSACPCFPLLPFHSPQPAQYRVIISAMGEAWPTLPPMHPPAPPPPVLPKYTHYSLYMVLSLLTPKLLYPLTSRFAHNGTKRDVSAPRVVTQTIFPWAPTGPSVSCPVPRLCCRLTKWNSWDW